MAMLLHIFAGYVNTIIKIIEANKGVDKIIN